MKLKFSSKLYSKQAVGAAVKAFDRFAKFRVTDSPKAYYVEISGAKEDVLDRLPGEFSNYVLAATREDA